MDVVTIVVQYTQDFEYSDFWEQRSADPFYQERSPDTLARIRTLLEKGLVSKLWRDTISDPNLWTTFLNASMAEDQFMRVAARAGDLPVAITFSAQNCAKMSDKAIHAIVAKSCRVKKRLFDRSRSTKTASPAKESCVWTAVRTSRF
jgi:hypothetical protein